MNSIKDSFSHRRPEPEECVLYIVGTPIGNLKDMSERGINILSNVSLIACEDTRNTGKLLQCLDISNKLISFNDHNAKTKIPFILSELKNGKSIALVSDAGMPLISDPGELLVNEARKATIEVITIPGPCAAIAALVSSGLPNSKFVFYGFLPKSGKERVQILNSVFNSKLTSIIYESPKRIIKLLLELKELCGSERRISISRELTKKYEQNIGNNLKDAIDYFNKTEPLGEFTIIIGPNENIQSINEEQEEINLLKGELLELIKAGLSHSSASIYLAKKYKKSKNKIYNLTLNDK
tara:strand:- start:741 stop:1628 length:888 start_codon:yes stop_codon:yes gene_type:complete